MKADSGNVGRDGLPTNPFGATTAGRILDPPQDSTTVDSVAVGHVGADREEPRCVRGGGALRRVGLSGHRGVDPFAHLYPHSRLALALQIEDGDRRPLLNAHGDAVVVEGNENNWALGGLKGFADAPDRASRQSRVRGYSCAPCRRRWRAGRRVRRRRWACRGGGCRCGRSHSRRPLHCAATAWPALCIHSRSVAPSTMPTMPISAGPTQNAESACGSQYLVGEPVGSSAFRRTSSVGGSHRSCEGGTR